MFQALNIVYSLVKNILTLPSVIGARASFWKTGCCLTGFTLSLTRINCFLINGLKEFRIANGQL